MKSSNAYVGESSEIGAAASLALISAEVKEHLQTITDAQNGDDASSVIINFLDHESWSSNSAVASDQSESSELPPLEWELQIRNLARLIEEEKEETIKLKQMETILLEKLKKLKADVEIAKLRSRTKDLEDILERKRNQKERKIRLLAIMLTQIDAEEAKQRKFDASDGTW